MKLFYRSVFIIIIAVLLAAVLLSVPRLLGSDRLTAEIYVNGELERTVELSEVEKKYTFSLSTEPEVEITVGRNEIFFSKADCKDKLCINSGRLTAGGQTAACLPAKVVVSVRSDRDKNDVMTY